MAWPEAAPTADELYQIAKSSLPRFLFQKTGEREVFRAAAEVMAAIGRYIDERYQQTFISRSTGIWVDQHLADRGSRRQLDETDVQARARCQTIADVATPDAVLAVVNDVLGKAGVTGTAALVQLGEAKAYFRISTTSGRRVAYLGRGFRMSPREPRLVIVILPYGVDDTTVAAIAEALRKRHAAGYPVVIERRRIP